MAPRTDTPLDTPAATAEAAAAPAPVTPDAPPAFPTGFPEPASAPVPREAAKPGHVILATTPPVGDLTVPPLEEGGETVVITRDGTEVDEETAQRAWQAAAESGFRLAEL